MKSRILLLLCLIGAFTLCLAPESRADIVVPGADGADLALTITTDTEIDLSQAITGNWDVPVAAGDEGKGIYDPAKWAIVFRYSGINIAAGTTVTFKNHPSRAPVIWLVNGDCTIEGTVNLKGQGGVYAPGLAEPGPGGFRGGVATFSTGPRGSAGFGPGGGIQQGGNVGQGGSFGTAAGSGAAYGNPSLVPLIGGSGGAGDEGFTGYRIGGGAGGGALLIACAKGLSLNGEIKANGGNGFYNTAGTDTNTGGGSGGGIRLVCETFDGSGSVNALGGDGWQIGGLGRIRLERVINSPSGTVQITPDPSVVDLQAGATALIFPPATAPTAKIVSIGGEAIGADPRAAFAATGADAVIPETAMTQVVIHTTNVEQASQVFVRLTPRSGANATNITAVRDETVTVDPLRWTADLPVNVGYSAVQVRVVRP